MNGEHNMESAVLANVNLYFIHYFWGAVVLYFAFAFYSDFFKVKNIKLAQSEDLVVRWVEAKRKGLIK